MYCETDDEERDELPASGTPHPDEKLRAESADCWSPSDDQQPTQNAERTGESRIEFLDLDEDEEERLRNQRFEEWSTGMHRPCPPPPPFPGGGGGERQERGGTGAGPGMRGGASGGSSGGSSSASDTRAEMLALAKRLAALPCPKGHIAIGKVSIVSKKKKSCQKGVAPEWQCKVVALVRSKKKSKEVVSQTRILAAESGREQRVAENGAVCKALEELRAIEGGMSLKQVSAKKTRAAERVAHDVAAMQYSAPGEDGQAGWVFQYYQCGQKHKKKKKREGGMPKQHVFCVVTPNGKEAFYPITKLRGVSCVFGDRLVYYHYRGFFVKDLDRGAAIRPPSAGVGVFYPGGAAQGAGAGAGAGGARQADAPGGGRERGGGGQWTAMPLEMANKGFQMLCAMGWGGGALGAAGSGQWSDSRHVDMQNGAPWQLPSGSWPSVAPLAPWPQHPQRLAGFQQGGGVASRRGAEGLRYQGVYPVDRTFDPLGKRARSPSPQSSPWGRVVAPPIAPGILPEQPPTGMVCAMQAADTRASASAARDARGGCGGEGQTAGQRPAAAMGKKQHSTDKM